ncbi:Hypothetical predicted protein [Cloeon dipterum]|nr:Hypothetical predicted protein [Cloeon dipterum]
MTNSLVKNMPAIQELKETIRFAGTFKTKMLVEIGSWDDSLMSPESLSKVAASNELTAKFSDELQQFIREYSLDGVFITWQYPTCPKHTCNPGVPQDRANVVTLMQSLKNALPPSRKMILLSLPPYPDALKGFNFSALEPIVDFFPVYSFNYGFHSLPVVKQISPLPDQKHIVESIVAKQGSYSKLIIGVPSIIEYFVLSDKKYNKVGAPQQAFKGGWIPIAEGCKRIKNGSYSIVRDPYASNYATLNTEWFSFEDHASMGRKVDFVKLHNIAGIWIKHAVGDDFKGECGCGIRPFTRMIAELLRTEGGCTYVTCP